MSALSALRHANEPHARPAVVHFVSRSMLRSRPEHQCSDCYHRKVCVPSVAQDHELALFDGLISSRHPIARGGRLYRAGAPFQALYAVHSGAFKTIGRLRNGDEKVIGFFLPGELIGLDAIDSAQHSCDAIALENSEACVLPFVRLERAAQCFPHLAHHLFRLLSRDISRDEGLMLLLGVMSAEQRLATFLLNLSRRYERIGFSAASFPLRMTRQDIGSYLGLQLETVSRQMSRFRRGGLIALDHHEIAIKNLPALMEMAGY